MLERQSLRPHHKRNFIAQEAGMLFGFDLSELFVFPFRDSESRKHFLVGCFIFLAGFVIPILPWLIASGYNAILMRQVLNGEKPHLVPWENWEALLKDGAKLFGIRLVYSSPLILLLVPILLLSFAFPFFSLFAQNGDSQNVGTAYFTFILLITGISLLIMPLSLAIGLILPAAEVHVIAKDDFMAGFQVREWWPIFKKNWSGFVVALAILYGLMMVTSFAMQILFMTLILICLLPILLPAISMYSMIIQYVTFTQAYKDGRDRLSMDETTS